MAVSVPLTLPVARPTPGCSQLHSDQANAEDEAANEGGGEECHAHNIKFLVLARGEGGGGGGGGGGGERVPIPGTVKYSTFNLRYSGFAFAFIRAAP